MPCTSTCARAPWFADSAPRAAQFHDKDDSSWSGKDSGWSGKDSGWSGGDDKPAHMKHDEGWSKQPQQPQPSTWSQPQPQPQQSSWSQPQPEAPKKDDKQVRTCLPRGTCSCACVTKCFSVQARC